MKHASPFLLPLTLMLSMIAGTDAQAQRNRSLTADRDRSSAEAQAPAETKPEREGADSTISAWKASARLLRNSRSTHSKFRISLGRSISIILPKH